MSDVINIHRSRAPAPLIAPDVDLRSFHFMPLDIHKLLNSDTWMLAEGSGKAAINLWCRSWHQIPAGSLPDDDRILAKLAGVTEWQYVREVALRGFVKCSDGRLYHPVICAMAVEAFARKVKRTESANARWKHKKKLHPNALHSQCESNGRDSDRDKDS